MKRVVSSLFVLFCILCLVPFSVSADVIDNTHTSSMNISYKYGDISISNTQVSLYYLGGYDESGNLQFTEEYAPVSFNPLELDTMGLEVQAKKVEDFITTSKCIPSYDENTNESGEINFSNLVPGIYFVSYDVKEIDGYSYYAAPVLVSIPVLQDGLYQYDINMNVKTEREQIILDNTPNGEDINVPNTIDNVLYYGVLLVISVLVIFGIMTYLIKIKEVKGEENDKK